MHFFIIRHNTHVAFISKIFRGSNPGGSDEVFNKTIADLKRFLPQATYEVRDERTAEAVA
jgi:hypothetical protein